MRILIIRTSALGDIVHCLPALEAIRQALPSATIGWVVESSMAPLLEGHPAIDELLIVALRRWRKAPFSRRTRREVAEFLRRLSAFGADTALDLMGNHKGALLAALSMADRRIGLLRSQRREPSSALWINEPVLSDRPHAVDRALAVAAAVGAETAPVDLGGSRLVETGEIDAPTGPYVLVFPATGWANKSYPSAALGQAAGALHEATGGWPVCVAPGPGEENLADEVVRASAGRAIRLPVAPLPELVALARRARLAIGGDTGPIHLARAVGTPVVCVMGPTDPERNGPYAAPEQALVEILPCSFCYKRFDEPKACLLAIHPKRLVEQALSVLDASS